MPLIHGADRYTSVDDLWIVTSYYNPLHYKTKLRNYEVFRESIERSRLNYLVIDCAFGDQPFSLSPSPHVMQVRARDVMWQKERLLSLALERLPSTCTKVAWLDCDILFENEDWALETSRLLDDVALVQPFQRAIRLPQGQDHFTGEGEQSRSFGAVYQWSREEVLSGNYDRHGHTGFAWAVRRDALTAGFYDACISGSGDHMMAHAACGDSESLCVRRTLGDGAQMSYYKRWMERFHGVVKGEIGCVPGCVLHLWHGNHANRRYLDRHRELLRLAFDPETDVRVGETGCWEWASDKHELHQWGRDYFQLRKEDGDSAAEDAA